MNAVIFCLRQACIIGILSSNRFYFFLFGSKRGNITNKKRNFYNNLFCPFVPPKKIFCIIGDCFKPTDTTFCKAYQKILIFFPPSQKRGNKGGDKKSKFFEGSLQFFIVVLRFKILRKVRIIF